MTIAPAGDPVMPDEVRAPDSIRRDFSPAFPSTGWTPQDPRMPRASPQMSDSSWIALFVGVSKVGTDHACEPPPGCGSRARRAKTSVSFRRAIG